MDAVLGGLRSGCGQVGDVARGTAGQDAQAEIRPSSLTWPFAVDWRWGATVLIGCPADCVRTPSAYEIAATSMHPEPGARTLKAILRCLM